MYARRVAASEVFWGLGFRRIPSGAAVVVEAPKTCQYYFSKFIKMFCCGGEAECASKQILNCGPYTQHPGHLAAWHIEDAEQTGAKRSRQKSPFRRSQRGGYRVTSYGPVTRSLQLDLAMPVQPITSHGY